MARSGSSHRHNDASRKSRLRRTAALALVLLGAVGLYAKKNKATNAVDQQKRALHALDRLTFGPRPGDVQAVAAIGVDKWIDLQLHPEKIDNNAMQARLAEYRTLEMSSREMLFEFPPNPVVKAVMDGKAPMPRNPYHHAIYAAAINRINQQQQEKKNAADVTASAQNTSTPSPGAPNSQAAIQPADLTQRRQDRRDAHGVVDELALLPPDTRMQHILALPVSQQRDLTQGLGFEKRQALLAGLTPEQREIVLALNNPVGVINNEVQSGKLLRAVYSDRQLEEVLTDFWFNHFNIFIGKGADRYLVTAYERDVIRPHVLGKFKDLLLATAQSPAMLFYLDNWQSEGPNSDAALGVPAHPQYPRMSGPLGGIARPAPHPQPNQQNNQQKRRNGLNENYARELMELHTLGVNGGYTQQDVTQVARVFTGWTIEEPRQGGDFVYRPRLHEPGEKVVLGHKIKDSGENEGREVLEILAHHSSTARFISTKLAQRFVSDDPPKSLIDAMSKTFLKTDGDLRAVLETMFHSPEFWAPEAYRARVKTPFEFVVSALRATQADISDPQPLLGTLNKMGMQLYGAQPPTGYSTKADVWVNSAALLDRMNFGLALAANRMQGTSFDLARLLNDATVTNADPYQMQLELEQALVPGDISKQTHETIESRIVDPQAMAQFDNPGRPANISVVAGLLLGSPEFQRK
ncbi:MAG: DUF1800 domain-containing protein [Candidatus Korobacteraceae bacterium]|jgi:uncharacterized protein (DUF1800 family)